MIIRLRLSSSPGGPTVITIGCLRALDRTGAPTRIGIAEDSAVVPAGLAEILADSGHAVATAVGSAGAPLDKITD